MSHPVRPVRAGGRPPAEVRGGAALTVLLVVVALSALVGAAYLTLRGWTWATEAPPFALVAGLHVVWVTAAVLAVRDTLLRSSRVLVAVTATVLAVAVVGGHLVLERHRGGKSGDAEKLYIATLRVIGRGELVPLTEVTPQAYGRWYPALSDYVVLHHRLVREHDAYLEAVDRLRLEALPDMLPSTARERIDEARSLAEGYHAKAAGEITQLERLGLALPVPPSLAEPWQGLVGKMSGARRSLLGELELAEDGLLADAEKWHRYLDTGSFEERSENPNGSSPWGARPVYQEPSPRKIPRVRRWGTTDESDDGFRHSPSRPTVKHSVLMDRRFAYRERIDQCEQARARLRPALVGLDAAAD